MTMLRAGEDSAVPGPRIYWDRLSPSTCSHLYPDVWGWHHLHFCPPAHLSYLPHSPEGACLYRTYHHSPGLLHRQILHLQMLAVWEESESASGHPTQHLPSCLRVWVWTRWSNTVCFQDEFFPAELCRLMPGLANDFYSSLICPSHFNP